MCVINSLGFRAASSAQQRAASGATRGAGSTAGPRRRPLSRGGPLVQNTPSVSPAAHGLSVSHSRDLVGAVPAPPRPRLPLPHCAARPRHGAERAERPAGRSARELQDRPARRARLRGARAFAYLPGALAARGRPAAWERTPGSDMRQRGSHRRRRAGRAQRRAGRPVSRKPCCSA